MQKTSEQHNNSGYPEKFAGMCRSVENYTRILAESMLYDLRMSMNMRILDAGRNVCFCACDESVYDSYFQLVRCYKSTLGLYEEKADVLASPKLKDIMQGIEEVIRARLILCPQEISGELALNPIFLEKKQIIHEEIVEFGKVFDALSAQFEALHMDGCRQYAQSLFVTLTENDYEECGLKLVGEIARRQEETMRPELYAACNNAVDNCEERLNGSGLRDEVLHYRELLDAEREILASIVKISLGSDGIPAEQSAAEEILAPITDMHEVLARNISEKKISCADSVTEIFSGLQEKNQKSLMPGPKAIKRDSCDEIWNGDLLTYVLNSTNYDGFLCSLKLELADVCHALEKDIGIVAENEISRKLYAKAAYEYYIVHLCEILLHLVYTTFR